MIEKSILVYYMNYDGLSMSETNNAFQASKNYFNKLFLKEITNDELIVLVIPVQKQPSKVELLNAKYPNWEEFQHKIEELKLYEKKHD